MSPERSTIERAYRVRLYPKPAQERALARILGARRFVWNWALDRKREAWTADGTSLTWIDLSREFTALRRAPGTAWLQEMPREPFEQTLRDFDRAWTTFFAGRARRPRRKRYGRVNSMRFTLDQRREQVDIARGRVSLPRIGTLRFRVTEVMAGRLRSVTIRRDAAGRWFAAFTADGVPAPVNAAPQSEAIGVDLGFMDSAVAHDGQRSMHVAAPRHLARKQARLRRYQRSYARRRDAALRRQGLDPTRPIPKGTRIAQSNRMRRCAARIGRLHARIADARRDHQHQLTTRLIAAGGVIAIEDINVRGMARGMGRRAFRRSAGDAALGELRRQIEYKARWHHRAVIAVDRYFPSSKLCSACGEKNAALTLRQRSWRCERCGARHQRDENAAINIRREGLRLLGAEAATNTRRSREIDARGEDACAVASASATGQPTSTNRELIYRAAPLRPAGRSRDGTRSTAEG